MPEQLEFYDLKSRTKFLSSNYEIKTTSKGMLVAETTAPSGSRTVKLLRRA